MLSNIKLVQAATITAGAAGTSDVNGSTVDMSGFEEVMAIVQFGAIVSGAVTSIKWQEGDASDMSDAADVTGTAQTIAATDDDKVFYIHVIKPRGRYGRVVIDRGTQNAECSAMYLLGGAKTLPVTHGTGIAGETHVSPAEGTA